MASNMGKGFLTGFLGAANKEYEENKEKEYELIKESRTRRDTLYATGHKLNKVNAASQAEYLQYAKEGGEANMMKLSSAMTPKDMTNDQKELFMQEQIKNWQKDPSSIAKAVRTKFPIDPSIEEYNQSEYADGDYFEAKRRAFDNWGIANMFGLEARPAKLREAVKKAKLADENSKAEVGPITLPMFSKEKGKRIRAGYYEHIASGKEVQGTMNEKGNVMVTDESGNPTPLTNAYRPKSLTEGIGQSKTPETKKVTAAQVDQYAPQIKQMLVDTPYDLRSGKTGEIAMVDAALQAWNDLTAQNRMSGTEASAYLSRLLKQTKPNDPKWGLFEQDALGFNDFDVPSFRSVIAEKLKELSPPTAQQQGGGNPPIMTPEQVKAAPSGTAYMTNDGRRGVKP